ncbi:NUDIX domain-containing protein [Blastococcus sp. Marseille-P5729]|uniref:NUDIX domain-containing protein n=1 Tax=Blastococcus sp. Marseille-P5729 TaxID=2086582 RepID=UPI001F1D7E50|nr:NUDIX hydrolase [Blastococcus sp. Marseille-P5729]
MDALPHRAPDGYRVVRSQQAYDGAIFGVRKDEVAFPDGSTATRDIVTHGGAVGVLAIDERHEVVLLQQYRHAVADYLWELPAGILDVDGEDSVAAAQRELAEEVGLAADRWDTLIDIVSAPGFAAERVRVFLARELRAVDRPADFTVEHEEADLIVRRVPLQRCLAAVHDGSIVNSIAVCGLLAADRALRDESLLRPADEPWPRPDAG